LFAKWLNSVGTGEYAVPAPLAGIPQPQIRVSYTL